MDFNQLRSTSQFFRWIVKERSPRHILLEFAAAPLKIRLPASSKRRNVEINEWTRGETRKLFQRVETFDAPRENHPRSWPVWIVARQSIFRLAALGRSFAKVSLAHDRRSYFIRKNATRLFKPLCNVVVAGAWSRLDTLFRALSRQRSYLIRSINLTKPFIATPAVSFLFPYRRTVAEIAVFPQPAIMSHVCSQFHYSHVCSPRNRDLVDLAGGTSSQFHQNILLDSVCRFAKKLWDLGRDYRETESPWK